jgi:O-antigen ligase
MLLLGLVVLTQIPISKQVRTAIIATVLLVGLAGFAVKYAGFFKKGATSVSARMDYWHAALHTARDHPLLGTGPGTFAIPYEKIKRPESEMSRLVHNDYLEQASDSGLPGCLLYLLFLGGILVTTWPRNRPLTDQSFVIWLGALGWSLQSLLEFSLYIPSLAWPALAFLGWLLARSSTRQILPPPLP